MLDLECVFKLFMLKQIIVIAILFFSSYTIAQIDDNILWSKFGISKTINEKTTVSLAPIVRYNDDISNYQNWSLDYSATYKFAKNWSAKLTGRTWFIPNGTNRQFIWPQIAYGKSLEKIKISTYLRYHLALDIKDNVDPDFIRWSLNFTFLKLGKFEPSLGIEPWLRLNTFNKIQRVRYQPGLKYTFSDTVNMSLTLWNEQNTTLANDQDFNIWVLALNYKL